MLFYKHNFFSVIPVSLRLPILLLIIWEFCVRVGWWPPSIIAPPSSVMLVLLDSLFNNYEFSTGKKSLYDHSGISFLRLIAGFLLGSTLAFLIGTWIGVSRYAEELLHPTLTILAPIPPIAWIPLVVAIFGIDELSKIMLIAIGTFFVVLLGTIKGIRSVDTNLIELANAYQKNKRDLIRTILIPSATPEIITSLRVALALSWILLIAAEAIVSESGLGWLIWESRRYSHPDEMIIGMIAIGVLGKITDEIMLALEKYILRWRQVFEGI